MEELERVKELMRKVKFCHKRAEYEQGRLRYTDAIMWYNRARGFLMKLDEEKK